MIHSQMYFTNVLIFNFNAKLKPTSTMWCRGKTDAKEALSFYSFLV